MQGIHVLGIRANGKRAADGACTVIDLGPDSKTAAVISSDS